MNAEQSSIEALSIGLLIAPIIALFALLLLAILSAALADPWIRGLLGGAPVSVAQLLGMRVRGVPPRLLVDSIVALVRRGYRFDPMMYHQAESLYLAQRYPACSPEQLADLTAKFFKSDGPG